MPSKLAKRKPSHCYECRTLAKKLRRETEAFDRPSWAWSLLSARMVDTDRRRNLGFCVYLLTTCQSPNAVKAGDFCFVGRTCVTRTVSTASEKNTSIVTGAVSKNCRTCLSEIAINLASKRLRHDLRIGLAEPYFEVFRVVRVSFFPSHPSTAFRLCTSALRSRLILF
jgi:hypothetical protein